MSSALAKQTLKSSASRALQRARARVSRAACLAARLVAKHGVVTQIWIHAFLKAHNPRYYVEHQTGNFVLRARPQHRPEIPQTNRFVFPCPEGAAPPPGVVSEDRKVWQGT